ncbi:MAG TPA: helix-turn-helix transcriptional regulator [Candidatus Tectomicrobia bacterium]
MRKAYEFAKLKGRRNPYVRSLKKVQRGSGNIFGDIGIAHPERVMTRAQAMFRIAKIIKERGLTQEEAATLLNIPQSKVLCLMNGKLSVFSLEQLRKILKALG